MDNIKEELQALPFWNGLTRGEQARVLANTYIRSYERGAVIHAKDQECLGLICLLSGRARAFLVSEDGREVTLYHLKKGDLDVLSAACVVNQITFFTQLVAQTDCRLLILPAYALAELKEKNLQTRCFIFEQLSGRFSDVMWMMQQTLFARVDTRLAAHLLKEARRAGGSLVTATHEEIAAEINSTREVITRMLRRFAGDGIVANHRGSVEILDEKKLREVAGK